MNEEKYNFFDYDPNTTIRILPYPVGLKHRPYYYNREKTNETILEKIPIEEIERFLRKKKLEKIEKNI